MASFPEEPISKIQMIGTIPGLGSMLITLVVGVLAMRIPKKTLALIGILCVALGGLLPLAFHTTVNALLVCALIMGIGLGFIGTINPMLISMYFEGEERGSLMGIGTAINSIGLMVMMIIGSTLGAKNWENTYLVFLLALLIFFVVMLFLPLDKVETKGDHTAQMQGPQAKTSLLTVIKDINKYVIWVSLLAFAVSFLYTIYPSNLSLVVAEKNFGGTAITGLVNALGTVGGLIAGFTISRINRILKDKSIATGFILLALSPAGLLRAEFCDDGVGRRYIRYRDGYDLLDHPVLCLHHRQTIPDRHRHVHLPIPERSGRNHFPNRACRFGRCVRPECSPLRSGLLLCHRNRSDCPQFRQESLGQSLRTPSCCDGWSVGRSAGISYLEERKRVCLAGRSGRN